MKKSDVLEIVSNLKLDKNAFWIVAGSAMCIYGLRQETNDVDLGCTSRLADELEKQGHPAEYVSGGRQFTIGENVEIFENFLFDRVVIVDDLPVISLQGLLEMKRKIGRPKDFDDIKVIEQYLKEQRVEKME